MAFFVSVTLPLDGIVLAWLILSISHALIDFGKARLEKRIGSSLAVFGVDQALCILLCAVVVAAFCDGSPMIGIVGVLAGVMGPTSAAMVLSTGLVLLIVWCPAAILVRLLFGAVRLEGSRLIAEVRELVSGLGRALEDRGRLAEIEASIIAYEREYEYFKDYAESLGKGAVEPHDPRFGRTSRNILRFWVREGRRVEEGRSVGFLYRAYVRAFFGGFYLDAIERDDFLVVPLLQDAFYRAKLRELRDEARLLKERSYDFEANMATIEEKSMRAFKAQLAKRYSPNRDRRTFELRSLRSGSAAFAEEYPVVLSTTHSITTSLGPGFRYDSVLMDEASQISVAAGALAFACAKNVVVVGDHKQLANVVKRERADETDRIADKYRVPDCYRYAKHSMLTSVLGLWPALEPTLLKEHYRCHPRIIGFCNKMYYDDDLVIMTKDEGERDVLSFHRTVPGNHERGRRNMRQVSVVCDEIIPELVDSEIRDIGVIAPFNPQVCELKKAVPEGVSVATVHKFQGRENDAIILSTVENNIGAFVGDPKWSTSRFLVRSRNFASSRRRILADVRTTTSRSLHAISSTTGSKSSRATSGPCSTCCTRNTPKSERGIWASIRMSPATIPRTSWRRLWRICSQRVVSRGCRSGAMWDCPRW